MNNYEIRNKLLKEIEKLVREIEIKKDEIKEIERGAKLIKVLFALSLIIGSILTVINMNNGSFIASIASLIGMLGVSSFLSVKDYKYEDILLGKGLDLKLLNKKLENKKAVHRELTNMQTKQNNFNLEKEELKDLEQVFNEVIDEEYTKEEKPKVRTRK